MRITSLAIAVALCGLLAGCRSSHEDRPIQVSSAPLPPRTVSVEGTAEIETAPDLFTVIVGVDTFAADASKAKQDNDATMRALLRAAKSLGVDDAGLKTDGFSLAPRVEGPWETRRVVGFDAKKNLVVTLHDADKIEPVLEALFREGANRLDQLRYESSKLIELRKDARLRAVAAAREKAQAMASALGQSVQRPLQVEERIDGGFGAWRPGLEGNAIFNNDTRAVVRETIASGKIKIPASVHITFELGEG